MCYALCAMCYILCNIGNVCILLVLDTFLYVLYVMCSALRDVHGAKCVYFLGFYYSSGNVLGSLDMLEMRTVAFTQVL